jgi:hypothetical protein
MSATFKHHDEENRIEKCWYDSSNILYTEINDKQDALKEIKIIFKGGRTYMIKDVKINDYLLFRENISQGVAYNKYLAVKGRYVIEKVENTDLSQLEVEKQLLIEKQDQEKLKILTEQNNSESPTI